MDKDMAISKIKEMLREISGLHETVSSEWEKYAIDNSIAIFNQKKNKVLRMSESGFIAPVLEYDNFLRRFTSLTSISDHYDCEGFVVNTRIKNKNSIMDKLEDYCTYAKEKGEVSINKCFNDLFGIRIVVDCGDLRFDDIKRCVEPYDDLSIEDKNFDLVCSETDYVATHIYFKGKGKERNKQFRWELQIWTKGQEDNNQRQHLKHRYKYRNWEAGNKNAP